MNNFTLPPPPPPPPKATPDADFSHHQGQNGTVNRGSFRGRGRSSNSRGLTRGSGFLHANASFPHRQSNQESRGGQRHHQNHRSNGFAPISESRPQIFGPGREQNSSFKPEYTSSSRGSFKRKRGNDHSSYQPLSGFQPKPRLENKPKVGVAPAVPSFGFSLPLQAPKPITTPESSVDGSNAKDGKQPKKRKSNQLGLTPQGDILEESEGEDVDEEAAFAAYKGPLRVEYNGVVTELGSAEALRQWIEERKNKFPTKARVEEKEKQALKERQDALRRKLMLQQEQKRDLEARVKGHEERRKKEKQMEQDAKNRKALEKHLAKANKLQKKLGIKALGSDNVPSPSQASMEETNCATEIDVVDAGPSDLRHKSQAETNEKSSADGVVKSPTEQESSESDSDESLLSDSSSSSDGPDETTSKLDGTVRVPPPNREPSERLCREFSIRGQCRRGANCRFKHETSGRVTKRKFDLQKQAPTERKSLYERLVEQELEAQNRLALQAIKYLGQNGFLDGSSV